MKSIILPLVSVVASLAATSCAVPQRSEVSNVSRTTNANNIALQKSELVKTDVVLRFGNDSMQLPPVLTRTGQKGSSELIGNAEPLIPKMQLTRTEELANAKTPIGRLTSFGNWRFDLTPRRVGDSIELYGEVSCTERRDFGSQSVTNVAITAQPGKTYPVKISHPDGNFVAELTPSVVE